MAHETHDLRYRTAHERARAILAGLQAPAAPQVAPLALDWLSKNDGLHFARIRAAQAVWEEQPEVRFGERLLGALRGLDGGAGCWHCWQILYDAESEAVHLNLGLPTTEPLRRLAPLMPSLRFVAADAERIGAAARHRHQRFVGGILANRSSAAERYVPQLEELLELDADFDWSCWVFLAPAPYLYWQEAQEGLLADQELLSQEAVAEPALIAVHREPLVALAAAARTAALRHIEQHSHAELTGCAEGEGGLDAPALAIAERLRADPALIGLEIVSIRVVERQGDERQIEAATAATVAAAQIDEGLRVEAARHRARLQELESRATVDEREHGLRIAAVAAQARERLLAQQAEVQQAALAARLEIVMAQIRAQATEIAHDEQLWQAEQARLQGEWERAQPQLLEAHQTDQQLRLREAERACAGDGAELALALQDRQNGLMIEVAAVQQRIAEQRSLQAQVIAERRAAPSRHCWRISISTHLI